MTWESEESTENQKSLIPTLLGQKIRREETPHHTNKKITNLNLNLQGKYTKSKHSFRKPLIRLQLVWHMYLTNQNQLFPKFPQILQVVKF